MLARTLEINGEFQSRSGFLPHRDVVGLRVQEDDEVFQSRSGFLPHRDAFICHFCEEKFSFNPVLGFYRIATSALTTLALNFSNVSIPFWVSTASRPQNQGLTECEIDCFNPVLGFYRIATVFEVGVSAELLLFQSRSGFLPHRDTASVSSPTQSQPFQSRSGFLPHRDTPKCAATSRSANCFNPVLGFYRIATVAFVVTDDNHVQFQSRSGFLPHRDVCVILPSATALVFQSRSGFLPHRDGELRV